MVSERLKHGINEEMSVLQRNAPPEETGPQVQTEAQDRNMEALKWQEGERVASAGARE